MAVTATRVETITFTGDVTATQTVSAASNAASPGQIQIVTLASGANTITAPTGGSTPRCLTVVPPAGNTNALTLKGVTGDTGVTLGLTDPFSVTLAAGFTTLCLTAGASTAGVRLIWS